MTYRNWRFMIGTLLTATVISLSVVLADMLRWSEDLSPASPVTIRANTPEGPR